MRVRERRVRAPVFTSMPAPSPAPEARPLPKGEVSIMNSYWRWKCEECGYEFMLALIRLPQPCHRCGGEWFLKIGEAASKENRID
jgi:hypothetical protein